MRISILSDFHFGFAWNTKLENDSFENAREAIEKALDSDLILIAGDIFDSRVPTTEVWARALSILCKPSLAKNKGVKLVKTIDKDLREISKRSLSGIPVIAIHGTHERRSKGQINAVEVLERTGFLIHLHCNGLIFEKNGIKVAIQGMSGVPERFAKQILDRWNPKPIEGCFNILMLHQSIDPFVYSPLEPPTLTMKNLPEGFDLIIDGHIHVHEINRLNDTTLLMPGSTVITQFKLEEANNPKGFYKIELNGEPTIKFIELEKARKFFFKEIEIQPKTPVRDQIEEIITSILKEEFKKPPYIKIKICGKEVEVFDRELREIEKKFSDRAIIDFSKELESPEVTEKIELLRNLRERKLSVEEMGLKILNENLKELNFTSSFNSDLIFRLLSDGEVERAFNILIGEQETLTKALEKSLKREESEKEKEVEEKTEESKEKGEGLLRWVK